MQVGDVTGGTVIVGDNNTVHLVKITARPVRRSPISQLPRPVADPLIGRERDVQVLRTAVETRQLVQVWGASGVGKSALLRHLARTLPRGPEGVAYIEAGGRTADDIAQAIFDISFDAPKYKPSPEVLKEHLKTLKLRIYLDDAGLDERNLRRLLDMAEQSTFVLTSQQPTALSGVHAVQLAGLTAPAAAELVHTLLGRELRQDETRIVKALCAAVEGNPLKLRRIAMSAQTGKGLPGITDLPELLPALVRQLAPEERDLLHLLGSLSGAELAARHLNDLLGRTDAATLAGGLVRHGLLIASETGYGCPPDVAACVLGTRKTEFPADPLCRTLTAWVEDTATTPDDVAAHFQALDLAVLRAETRGSAQLGVALARAASPKLALSRQFDAWGSLLGAGWTVARTAGDKKAEEFFLHEARTRRRAIGRAAQTTALVLEAEVLFKELATLHAHALAAPHLSTAAAALTPPPIHLLPAPHVVANPPTFTPPPTTPPPVHVTPPVHMARPVFDLTKATQQPPAAAHATGTHPSAVHVPKKIDLSKPHASHTGHAPHSSHASHAAHASHAPHSGHTGHAAHATHHAAHHTAHAAAHASHAAASAGGHTAVATGVAATGKAGGMSALALTCTIGAVAVVGVGATIYATNQSSVDPACTAMASTWSSEVSQYNSDFTAFQSASDNSTQSSDAQNEINDLQAIASTVQQAQSQAKSSSVQSDLNTILTLDQQLVQQFQTFANGPQNSTFDDTSQVNSLNSAVQSLQSDCGS
ncbi:AAA family ATPase [Streptacidiphilus fuscans]|uniref:ORC1/DEAH AAA+ ATPase domain-containing protein n=1 Tax=Streptacidiphilus fuscans TaxID=2789292 RepID=A0A931B1A3_9ACTN|nr:AAA family ATPase [Streptacidiphilus fuscans]MBF9068398.1 hypothetical protein [Streptacidiphilus fuscans]